MTQSKEESHNRELINITEKDMKELISIVEQLKAPKSQFNTFGNYKYRRCEDILEAVKPLLKEHNCILTINDEIVLVGDRFYIKATATLTNAEGVAISTSAYAREEKDKKGMDGSQVTGMASSYARKYALNGLFCIDDTKDADTLQGVEKEASKPKEKPIITKYILDIENRRNKFMEWSWKDHQRNTFALDYVASDAVALQRTFETEDLKKAYDDYYMEYLKVKAPELAKAMLNYI